jgi:hypothetical protein
VPDSHGPLSPLHQSCLRLLRDLSEVCSACGTRTFIWGGMSIDVQRGAFVRDHRDVDGFTLDLLQAKDDMMAMLNAKGYSCSFNAAFDMLRVAKDDVHAGLNRLETEHGCAMWRHVGDHGTIYFPLEWLDSEPRGFYGLPLYTSGPRFEYAIKTNAYLLNPTWELREKDREAIEWLSGELDRLSVDRREMLTRIWSHTPFWVERGYPQYEGPVRITTAADASCKG